MQFPENIPWRNNSSAYNPKVQEDCTSVSENCEGCDACTVAEMLGEPLEFVWYKAVEVKRGAGTKFIASVAFYDPKISTDFANAGSDEITIIKESPQSMAQAVNFCEKHYKRLKAVLQANGV